MFSEITAFLLFLFNNLAAVFLIGFLLVFGYVFWKENKSNDSPLRWVDMLLDKKQNRLSMTKFWQFIGSVVFIWVVITMTIAGTITSDILGIVGAFILGGFGWSTFVKNKEESQRNDRGRGRGYRGDPHGDGDDAF